MAFVIPSIFTVIDRATTPIRQMTRAVGGFIERARESEEAFKKSKLGKNLEFVGEKAEKVAKNTAVAGAAIAAPLVLAAKAAVDFDSAMGSFRTIVSDLDDSEFSKYGDEIKRIGRESKKSYVDVAQTFEAIAGNNADFAKTPQMLAGVSQSVITLAQAAREDLGPTADRLVGIMNQFKVGADQSQRFINVLAAGQAEGASTIIQSADAYVNAGAVMQGANVTFEQSQGLIQTLAAQKLVAAEAGTALRGTILKLQKAGVGYKSGIFQIDDALADVSKRFKALKDAKAQDAYLTKIFGQEGITAGRILVTNIDQYEHFTKAVTGTSAAQQQAAINNATAAERMKQLKAQVSNLAVDVGEKLLPYVIQFFEWLSPIIQSTGDWIQQNQGLVEVLLKGAAILSAVMFAISGVSAVVTVITKATTLWKVAQWMLNTSLFGCPIMWIVGIIALLVAAIAWVASKTTGWGETWSSVWDWIESGFMFYVNGLKLGFLLIVNFFMNMVNDLYTAWLWLKNKLGVISDEEHRRELENIAAQKKARLQAMAETAAEMKRNADRFSQGVDWQVDWKENEQPTYHGIPFADAKTVPVINPYKAQMDALSTSSLTQGVKDKLEITVKDQTGGNAEVTKNTGAVPVNVTKTLGGNYLNNPAAR